MAQERSSARIFIVAVGLLAAVHAVAAKDINVGGTRGWDYAPPSDAAYYDTWASKETFTAGDNLGKYLSTFPPFFYFVVAQGGPLHSDKS